VCVCQSVWKLRDFPIISWTAITIRKSALFIGFSKVFDSWTAGAMNG